MTATSPQGRFDDGAALLDGVTLERTEAWGKHLFCWWEGEQVLHVHLGLIGKFRSVNLTTEPRDTIRLRLETDDAAWQLSGPQTCAVVTKADRNAVVKPLGPDPLRRGSARKGQFVDRLRSTRRAAGVTLLDQGIVAGIGNVYRAELLFLLGIHPSRPSNQISEADAEDLWDLTVSQLRRGREWNRIITVSDDDIDGRVTRRLKRDDCLYAYKRTGLPCRRCHDPIAETTIGGRSIWYCSTCQPS